MIRVRHLALACSLVHICPREIKQEADFSVVDIEDYWIGSSKNSQDVVASSLLRTALGFFLDRIAEIRTRQKYEQCKPLIHDVFYVFFTKRFQVPKMQVAARSVFVDRSG